MVSISPFRKTHPPAHAEPAFDVEQLGREIEDGMRDVTVRELAPIEPDYAPPLPLPSYVTASEDISQAGRLTAQVVVQQYEQTAKEIEEMATDLVEMHKRMEQETQAVHRVIDKIRELAQAARDEGKAAFERIERMARATADVDKICDDIRTKLSPQ
jgi:methyl-accepting chemotaxis protein